MKMKHLRGLPCFNLKLQLPIVFLKSYNFETSIKAVVKIVKLENRKSAAELIFFSDIDCIIYFR